MCRQLEISRAAYYKWLHREIPYAYHGRLTASGYLKYIVVFVNHLKLHNSSPFAHSVFLIRDLYCGYSVINRLITLASFQ